MALLKVHVVISVACTIMGASVKRAKGSIMISSCFLFNFVISDSEKEYYESDGKRVMNSKY